MWQKAIFPPFTEETAEYALERRRRTEGDLAVGTPYRLVSWENEVKTWEDQITEEVITEEDIVYISDPKLSKGQVPQSEGC